MFDVFDKRLAVTDFEPVQMLVLERFVESFDHAVGLGASRCSVV